jgi:hypothetical protein
MKIKTVFAASLFATGVAFADSATVDAECILGVLPVAVAAGQNDIILNIPWIEASQSSTGEGVAVVNLVKTANLSEGDMLFWYDGSAYQAWTIDENDAWVPTPVSKSTGIPVAVAATTETLQRGQAIILHRLDAEDAATIYIVGQYKSTSATPPTIASGASGAPVYTLIAPPNTTDPKNLKTAFLNPVEGDSVTFMKAGSLKSYYYKKAYDGENDGWCSVSFNKATMKEEYTAATDDQMTIPVGTGLYYMSRGTGTTVSW